MSLENYNYANDPRVQAYRESQNIEMDFDKMTITYKGMPLGDDDTEDLVFPGIVVVCPTCGGRGRHVNPSIDAGGISQDEFYEDPDFFEEYRSGLYDVTCYECKGRNVVLEIDEERADAEKLKKIQEYWDDQNEMRAEYLAELRMGC